jgi:hypothetical protein
MSLTYILPLGALQPTKGRMSILYSFNGVSAPLTEKLKKKKTKKENKKIIFLIILKIKK